MIIDREQFINDLEMVKAGLSAREFIEQSSCFVFREGMVMTFNDEIACRKQTQAKLSGAVQANTLLDILHKLEEKELKILQQNDDGELEFRGKRKRFGVMRDAEIFLPIDRVEVPEQWSTLPKEFTEAVGLVSHCVSSDESKFVLTCVHLAPTFIEACDNFQMIRCKLKTGLSKSMLVRGSSLSHIMELGMDKIATTKNWIHFQNTQGLILSCRRFNEQYMDLSSHLKFEGHPIVIPKGLTGASDRAAVFASDKNGDPVVSVKLGEGKILIEGSGITGWYKEVKSVSYDGPPMSFVIAPDLLRHISESYSDAQLTKSKLKVSGGHWEYVTVLGRRPKKEKQASED